MNTGNYLTDEEDLLFAHDLCKGLRDNIKNKAIANVYAAKLAKKYFNTDNYDIDESSGLHNVPEILQNYDIADIYLDNNYIDVRLSFENDTLTVPRKNIENGFVPEAFMFISINKDFSNVQILGFYLPNDLENCKYDDEDYFIEENKLITIYDAELHFDEKNIINHKDEELFDFLNDTSSKYAILNELITNKDSRLQLIKYSNAKNIFMNLNNNNSNYENNIDESNDIEISTAPDDNNTLFDNDLMEETILNELNNDDSEIASLIEDDTLSENIDINNDTDELNNDESSYDYSTEITPSLHEDEAEEYSSLIEEDGANDNDEIDGNTLDLSDIIDSESNISEELDNSSEISNDENNVDNDATSELTSDDNVLEPSPEEIEPYAEDTQNSDESNNNPQNQLDTLFDDNNQNIDSINDNMDDTAMDTEADYMKQKTSNKKFIITALSLAIIVSAALLIHNKNTNVSSLNKNVPIEENSTIDNNSIPENAKEAMPIETIETNSIEKIDNETAESVAIPAIENNLDASILVSNLKITWEVPAGYASNTAAKRYLVKLGKIIQLNLKTELLLLNKPPITNKIAVEISFNSSDKKFGNAKIITSSGEKSIDDVIISTVNKVLSNNLTLKTDSISGIQGNPILIIHL